MKAIAIVPGTPLARMVDRPEPQIQAPDEIKLEVLSVGICGTDREQAAGGRALLPAGQIDLVIGHEMLGRVLETGAAVTRVKPGDLGVLTVRRGCGGCQPCLLNRPDMCLTGNYRERGIWGLDGYQTECVVDQEMHVTRVPPGLEAVGVLTEPLSVVEKAIDEAVSVQLSRLIAAASRPQWLFGRRCLVAGLGPIGLLAALALRLRGAEVYGLDIVDAASPRPKWLEHIGGVYVDGRKVSADRLDVEIGPMEVIIEAAGVAALQFNLLDALAPNGVYVLTGIPGDDRSIQIPGGELLRQLVLNNQVMIGTVNAARDHYQIAVDDLARAQFQWDGHLSKLITKRVTSEHYEAALHQHSADEIKTVIEW